MVRVILAGLVVVTALVTYVIVLPVPDEVGDSPWMVKTAALKWRLQYVLKLVTPIGINEWFDERAREDSRAAGPNVPYTDAVFDRVPVRIFTDEPVGGMTAKRPAIVYFHGGGWIRGSVDGYHPVTALLARKLNLILVSVEYRLAPKYVFPTAIDDCTAATVWFLEHLNEYNVDPARVALMGDSAGGNLAAATAQRLTFDKKYRDLPKVKLQVLIYPALQAFDFKTPSYQQYGDYSTLILDTEIATWMWSLYGHGRKDLGSLVKAKMTNNHTSAAAKRSPLVQECLSHGLIPDEFKQSGYESTSHDFGDEGIFEKIKGVLLDPDYAPLMRKDLRGLPEAYILTAEYDVLRDDGIMYAKRLEKGGVPVTWKHYMKGYHGMFSLENRPLLSTTVGDKSVSDFIQFARQNLHEK
ncbi:neutral cholesterol ester hydrolase 1-like [Acanthaster planci]|uniref:Neutral cholesterol ester hydrolase 1-like n=1 Tax=Acanthaster planci TaxID=133434 RepID=A0A8B7ZAN6_ACAPL|nr:neutral cholesterol ester hydrolase 1-like [Acanthaster planci]